MGIEHEQEHEHDYEGAELPGFIEGVAESFQVNGKRGAIEGVESLHVLEELMQLRFPLEAKTAVAVQRVRQPIEREDQAFRALAQDRNARSLHRELAIR